MRPVCKVVARMRSRAGFAVSATMLWLVLCASGAAADVRSLLPFDVNTGWINPSPLSLQDLRGKIVLVDFWEYTCINCLRILPYEKAWYERYKQDGFVIIGVHTPEFGFSGEMPNVATAVSRLGIGWPVVLDSNMAIWQRYQNQYWPHEFLFDQEGNLVLDHAGEGDYPETETRIQHLVMAAHPGEQLPSLMALLPQDNYAKRGAVCYPQTPEVYVGVWRGSEAALGNREGYHRGQVVTYSDSGHNHFDGLVYLEGPWLTTDQAMVHARADSGATDYLALRYHALQVVSVLKAETGKPMTVYVEQDGKPIAHQDAGADIRYDSNGRSYAIVDAPRAYELMMNRRFGPHDLRLSPIDYGLGIYSFAFESCEVGSDR